MNTIQIESLFLALGLGFSSCISTRDTARLNKIEIGMTKEEVSNLLGKPRFRN
ncbi:MAG: outer membrane protein assembly factor BamE, partial [Bacteroidaceae bacterium]|nr:outer membrane protein assembly factor BamE [Bacteroidaceae bacterium]